MQIKREESAEKMDFAGKILKKLAVRGCEFGKTRGLHRHYVRERTFRDRIIAKGFLCPNL